MYIAVLKKIGFAVLLLAFGMATVWAGPGDSGRGGFGPSSDFRNASNFNNSSAQQPGQPAGQEPARSRGKLSPDERRQLRRQINEAGQDIYGAKH